MPRTEGPDPRIHYHRIGQGPPLVLLNGLSAPGRFWPDTLLTTLAEHHTVLCVDHRGTGASDRVLAPFTITDMATDVQRVIRHAATGRAVVVGTSMGGLVAQAAALDHPAEVAGLVAVSTAAGALAAHLEDLQPRILAPLMERAGGSVRTALRALWEGLAAPGFAQRTPRALEEMERVVFAHPTPMATLGQQLLAVAAFDARSRLAALDVPTLVLHGDQDPLVPLVAGQELADAISGAKFEVLAGVGHLAGWEAPEAVAEHVLAFTRTLERSRSPG